MSPKQFDGFFQCKSGAHYHENKHDAELCCNGYVRMNNLAGERVWIHESQVRTSIKDRLAKQREAGRRNIIIARAAKKAMRDAELKEKEIKATEEIKALKIKAKKATKNEKRIKGIIKGIVDRKKANRNKQ